MKKFSAIIIAMALVLGMSQCKKQETPASNNTEDGMVYITVNVDNGGGRHHIEPSVGAYIFTNGDKLYVGNNGHYVGTLEYQNGAFSGGIQSPSTEDYLHFYFLGGKEPASAPTTSTTDFTINIANQSSNLPLLAYGRSAEFYGASSYTTTLRNKCALVKFELLAGTTNAVTVSNMLTEATIDFATPGITPKSTTGTMTLYSESDTKKWAILLPQEEAISSFTVNIGTRSYTVSGSYPINNNGFINSGIVVANSVNLSNLTTDYPAQDGDVLTGILANDVKISIANNASVTLRDVNINGDGDLGYGQHAGITCVGNARITLEGTNVVRGFHTDYPGVFVPDGYTLTIDGTGSLNASSEYGAGIGGGYWMACGNITIENGRITATGGMHAAGIGGGEDDKCGNIWIKGGTITATGGREAAGIGGGASGDYGSSCGTITIENTVTRITATKGEYAPYSIGAGYNGTCGTVKIGGTVTGNISDSPYIYQP
jgi:hypothetical protein